MASVYTDVLTYVVTSNYGESMEAKLRATYRGVGPYKAVIKDAKGKIVAECEHWHRNRDIGESARSCGFSLLREVDLESWEAALPSWMRVTS